LERTHRLRTSLNDGTLPEVNRDQLDKTDLPVVASTVKLWLLEMDPPLIPYAHQEDLKLVFKNSTSQVESLCTLSVWLKYGISGMRATEPDDTEAIESFKQSLLKIPKVHLLALDAFVGHLAELVATTKTEEDDATYLTKLGLSLGRCEF
jgi:hypothetical protein